MSWMARVQGIVKRAVVDLVGERPQLLHSGDGVLPDVEYLQPQGLHFRAPVGADGVVLSVGAQTSNSVAVNLSGPTPTGDIKPGEGGLHYLGAWRVFLAEDGTVSFGDQVSADFVALASLVDAELGKIKTDLDNVKKAHDTHIHITTATIGSGPAVGVLSPPEIKVLPAPHSPASVASEVLRAK